MYSPTDWFYIVFIMFFGSDSAYWVIVSATSWNFKFHSHIVHIVCLLFVLLFLLELNDNNADEYE